MFDIQEELKKLPKKSGVYIMKDENGCIIYVGKAVNLSSRVRQYFQDSSRQNSAKVHSMAANISEFEYVVTDNEVEALILECNLIKKHTPKYNVMLKDDKSYPYVKLTVNEAFPRALMVRKVEKDKAKYFGPFTSSSLVRESMDLMKRIWPLRTCSRKLPADIGKGRPCLNYDIGQCKAPCAGFVSESEYKLIVDEALLFLSGKHEGIAGRIEREMNAAAEKLEFEKAAELRDKLRALKILSEKQKIDSADGEDQDIIAFARAGDEALVQVFFVRGGKMLGREHYMLVNVLSLERREIMAEFVKQFYCEAAFIPKELVLEVDVQDKEALILWLSKLRGKSVSIVVPQRGDKQKMVELAAKNAILTLEQFGEHIKRERMKTEGALAEIKKALKLNIAIDRIEAYDISNVQGFESVGSMVAFEGGKPKNSDYRKFKIKSVQGPDDYASMEEVIGRRFSRYLAEAEEAANGGQPLNAKFLKLPDILFIDGGRGQVHSAQRILSQLELNIPVCGMIKDDRHRTRGLFFNEEEILLPQSSEGFKLVTRIQDEVHRFAIEYHRKLREAKSVHSILDDIKGIGPARRKELMKHFKSIENVKKASVEELQAVAGMNRAAAESVYKFFRI
ncbi:MAG: excinuclease ABC subunit UvrC [Clostridiales bacterium]|jgi:excinuclease ABC subunit C|nr:excinuclease ABC subunit UvrC [Clostridiales bacterium]